MVAAIRRRLDKLYDGWLERRHPPRDRYRLSRRQLYILPTKIGYSFTILLLTLLLWSINYSNGIGFGLTFLLAAIAHNSMWRVHQNLHGLSLAPAPRTAAFAGQPLALSYTLQDESGRDRKAVLLATGASASAAVTISAHGSGTALLVAIPAQRGWYRPSRLQIFTSYPLGLFRAWSWVAFDERILIYPQPRGHRPLPVTTAAESWQAIAQQGRRGYDDFEGFRAYQRGDSPRHIAWKVVAHSEQLLVKRFSGQAQPELWLRWEQVADLGLEEGLSQLCQWVLLCEEQGQRYGLALPDTTVPSGHGPLHRHRCLEALALM